MEITKLKASKSFGGETAFYEHDSVVTKTKMKFSVYLPPGSKPDGCVIWLSGLTCNEENFITKAGAQKYLSENNMMVICPDTSPRGLDLPQEHESWDFGAGAGFYVNATTEGYKEHYKMFDYIDVEILDTVVNNFNIDAKKISIAGHSMGGHGALVLGLTNPEKFTAISAFAPLVNPIESTLGQKALAGYLGVDNKSEWEKYDACKLVASGRKHPHRILVDQGTDDEFLADLMTSNLQSSCDAEQQELEVNFRAGYDHGYYFIATFINNHLAFHKSSWTS
jgi:S-formylglutathione hydrolase